MNPRRRRFVHEYLKDLNATQAYVRAGYRSKNPDVDGPALLGVPGIRAAVDAAIAQRAVRVEAKTDDVLRELLRLATVDVGLAYDKHGALLPLHKMPEDVRRAIAGIECVEQTDSEGVVTGVLKKVKFSDKKGPLELLGKHLRMFDERKPGTGLQTSAGQLSAEDALKILQLVRSTKSREAADPETEH